MNLQTILLLPIAYLLVVSIPLLITDIRESRLKNSIVFPGYLVWLVSAIAYTALSGDWLNALVLPLAIGLPLLVGLTIFNIRTDAIGMGDVKLIVLMGLTLSWKSLWVWLTILVIALFIGLVVTAVLAFRKRYPDTISYTIRLGVITYLVYITHLLVLFTK
jgi:leader peptidase (prepilin peptidase)/N-methyltransferase